MKDKKVREELIIDAFAMLFLLAGELYFFRNIIDSYWSFYCEWTDRRH